ncbi:MAG: hypothetical protein ABI234_03860 [Ktedonobacteraceae bacterium]
MKAYKTGSIKRQPRRNFGLLLLGLLVLAIIAVIAIPLYFGRMMMGGSPPQTAQQFALASPGTSMSVALEVTSLPTTTLFEGTLLQRNDDGSYSRTSQHVSVQWNPSQSMTMGRSSDIKVGGILQIHGTLGTNTFLTASQIVVLTGYVQIK